ncbi:MAG TPA: hypothetical protein VFQ30_05670, partial [Ktedonobacteraceae bacterium]|nr:hypothetical protein [Ktedonobacteraceae bacterium]
MKRQFFTQPFGNNAYPSGQPASNAEWSPATDAQSGVLSGPNASSVAPRPGSGLLSGWKSGQVYTADLANQMSRPAMQEPITGPTLNPGAAHVQASPARQPSTYQSGMTPEPMQPFHGNGYARGNADIQSFSQSGQQQVQMPPAMAATIVGVTASPFQQQSMQPFGMQNMAPAP